MPARTARTARPPTSARTRKLRSTSGPGPPRALRSGGDSSAVGASVVTATVGGLLGSTRNHQLVELRDRLALKVGQQWGVARAGRLALAAGEDEVQEALQRVAGDLVGLLGVHDDPCRRGDRVRLVA